MLLCDALSGYPDARIDLFHAGYPWVSEIAAMAKNFTAVNADLCWMHIVSPSAACRALDEWLDAIPASKIFAFGGDYMIAEGSYGHSVIARTNIGEVLANRVENGRMNMADAKRVARMILRNNAIEFFGLT